MSLQINFRAGLITDMLKRTNIILSILCLAVSIQQVCENDDQCPSNSICNLRLQTCKCISGFIGQCNISALALTNNTITVEMNSSNIQYFSISPLEVNQFLDIRINICQINSQDKLQAYFWGETGHQYQYLPNNTFVPTFFISFDGNCSFITLANIYFYPQKNGDSQKLILGFQNNNEEGMVIEISAEQKKTFEIYLTHYFTIGLLVMLLFLFCMCMLVNICRRSRLLINPPMAAFTQNSQQEYNIDYFETYLPKTKMKNPNNTEILCPICLQNIEDNEIIRQTPCDHVFHSVCLDVWCKKNVNCPVCRSDLAYEYVKALKDSLKTQGINKSKGYTKRWEEDIQLEQRYTGDNSSIRQEMM